MLDLVHALRAISTSLADRAKRVEAEEHAPVPAMVLREIGQALADGADSLEHRWREANERLSGRNPE